MVFNKNLIRAVVNPHNWINMLLAIGAMVAFFTAPEAMAQSGNVYRLPSVQSSSPVMRAIVIQARDVEAEVSSTSRHGGSVAGAVIGAALGAKLGEHSNGAKMALGLVGTVLGGLAGQAATEKIGGVKAVEYIVQMMDGDHITNRVMAITQPAPAPAVAEGSQVYLIQTGATWRVVPARQAIAQAHPVQPSASDAELAAEILARSYRYTEVSPATTVAYAQR
jgi:outer membrane lipoprotein SlyB